MRFWHISMIKYLPDLQLKGQWRECALIADSLARYGTPNHLLVNRITEYPFDDFATYTAKVKEELLRRGIGITTNSVSKVFFKSWNYLYDKPIFECWHNKEYLRVCYANLYEKHKFGIGKSRITDEEWQVLLDGYMAITGEEYVI